MPGHEARRSAAQAAWRRSIGLGWASVALEGGRGAGVAAVADVAEHHQGVAPQLVGVAAGQVPAAVAGEQLVVGGGQQVEHGHVGDGAGFRRGRIGLVARRLGGHTSWQSSQP